MEDEAFEARLANAQIAMDDLVQACGNGSRMILDNLGLTIRASEVYLTHARAHLPHLLRRRTRRLRKKALRDLPRRMSPKQKRHAFVIASMAAAEGAISG